MAHFIKARLIGEQRVKKSGQPGWIGFFMSERGKYYFEFKQDSAAQSWPHRSVKNYDSKEDLRQAANRFLQGDETC